MEAWGAWAQTHAGALVDPGAPLFRKRILTATSVAEFEDARVGYAIVEAASHEAAVDIFSTHPHLSLHPANSIEVMECPEIPAP